MLGLWFERFAERMSLHWDVEVLTTCAAEPVTWRDFHDPGPVEVGRVRLRRFRVDYPRCPAFAAGVMEREDEGE